MKKTIFRVAAIGFAILLISATLEDCGIITSDHGPPKPLCANADRDGDGFSFIPACGSTVDCDDSDPDNWISCDTCGDADGDLFYAGCDDYSLLPGPDCDDGASLIYPGAFEECDEVDNQCEGDEGFGEIDEGCGPPCTDGDEDGFCAEADYGPDQDCDDTDPSINPGMADSYCDGIDANCDGMDKDPTPPGEICPVTMEIDPVCGVNGITYENPSHTWCDGCVEIACWGPCPCYTPDPGPFCDPFAVCVTLWDPVCGMDGVTYGNECEAHNWGCTEIACYGMCPCW
jgi:hypothetical protein